jgi:DNA-binding response OmpR family regulator
MVSHRIKLKHVILDQKEQTCLINQTPVILTHKEFQLIFKLLSYPNKIFTREELMDEIWGFDSESYERTVDTHIKRLRDHFQVEDFEIVTVRGLGYKVIINEKNID